MLQHGTGNYAKCKCALDSVLNSKRSNLDLALAFTDTVVTVQLPLQSVLLQPVNSHTLVSQLQTLHLQSLPLTSGDLNHPVCLSSN